MAKAQLVFINRSVGTGTGGAPAAVYESYVVDEGTISLPADGRFKTALIIPIEEDIYLSVGVNPDVDIPVQQILVPLGHTYEVAIGLGQRFAIKASGTNAGAGAGGEGGGGTGSDVVKIDATQNTVKIDETVPVSGPLTDTQLRATALPVTGTVTANGPLTDTQLRATAVPVSGPITDTQLRAAPVDVNLISGHFRPLPVGVNRSGTVTTADAWQVVAASNPARTALTIQAISDNSELFITEFPTAGLTKDSPGVYRVSTGQVFWALSSNTISVLSSTQGDKFTATETGYE